MDIAQTGLHIPTPVIVVVAVIIVVALLAKRGGTGKPETDPRRMFSPAQRAEGKRRAGGRCEHASSLGFRCRQPGAHSDHVFPWSKGGATALSNHAWLCAHHNTSKGAKIPSRFYIRSLERRRRRYFPEGVDPRIEWRIGRAQ